MGLVTRSPSEVCAPWLTPCYTGDAGAYARVGEVQERSLRKFITEISADRTDRFELLPDGLRLFEAESVRNRCRQLWIAFPKSQLRTAWVAHAICINSVTRLSLLEYTSWTSRRERGPWVY